MEKSLVIMAAGIGSRFGGGIKQLAPVGPNGEIILEYSIHDALEAGFDRVVFIIRRDLEDAFRATVGARIEKICPVAYAFQEKDDLPGGFTCPTGRKKPWGTGQAVLACRDILHEPFLVINADDYYGKQAFALAHGFLVQNGVQPGQFCMPGFILKNTLSDNGAVTRGVCTVRDGYLCGVRETGGLVRDGVTGAAIEQNGVRTPVDGEAIVSMNMWGLTPDFISVLQQGFSDFLSGMRDPCREEYLLPAVIDALVRAGKANVRVLATHDRWFGVTYSEDQESVRAAFRSLYARGVYPKEGLFTK